MYRLVKIAQNNPIFLTLLAILLLASVLRLYSLGSVPPGLTWDEAAIGDNGYAVFTTRRDEWLQRLPVSFKSFGDFKAPLAIYVTGLFTVLLGLEVWVVRLPFAFSGVLGVLALFLVTQELWYKSAYKNRFALLMAGLLAISPWHLQFTRAAFESGIALTAFLFGVFFFLRFTRQPESKFSGYWLLVSGLLLVASLYTYHSAKVVIPVFLLVLAVVYRRTLLQKKRALGMCLIISLLFLYPLLSDSFRGEGLQRASVTIFSSGQPAHFITKSIFTNYGVHLHPNFLNYGKTTSFRHGDGRWGVLLPTTFALGLIGLFATVMSKSELRSRGMFYLIWIVIGLLPAAIALEVPHSNRALFALPGFLGLTGVGLVALNHWLLTRYQQFPVNFSVLGTLCMVHVIVFIAYLNHYYRVYPLLATDDFNDGYVEAFRIAHQYERGNGVDKVERIIFTADYDHPYIYALFVRRTNPIWYQGGSLNSYLFTDTITESDLSRPNALIVASGSDPLPLEKAQTIIWGADGSVRFKLYRTPAQ